MIKLILIIAIGSLCLACAAAFARPPMCLPGIDNSTWLAGPVDGGVTANGAWLRWNCAEVGTGQLQTNLYVGTVPELSKVGARVQTIIKAADPLKSLQTLPNRITVLPLTDPSLAAIVADVK